MAARDVLLFTILEKIREEQRHHTTLLNALFARLGNSESSMQEDDIPEGIHFPIMNKEEMKSFEDNLKDSNSEKLVVSQWIFFSSAWLCDLEAVSSLVTQSNTTVILS